MHVHLNSCSCQNAGIRIQLNVRFLLQLYRDIKLDESWDFQFLQNVEKNTIIFTQSMDSEMLQKIVKNSRNTEELNIKWSTDSLFGDLDFSVDSVYKIRMLTLYFYSQNNYNRFGNIPYNAIKHPLLLILLQN